MRWSAAASGRCRAARRSAQLQHAAHGQVVFAADRFRVARAAQYPRGHRNSAAISRSVRASIASTSSSKCPKNGQRASMRANTSPPCSRSRRRGRCRSHTSPAACGGSASRRTPRARRASPRCLRPPARIAGPQADVHALDHIQRCGGAQVLHEPGIAEHQVPVSLETCAAISAHRLDELRVDWARSRRRGARDDHRGECPLQRAHRNRPQAVALIDHVGLLGEPELRRGSPRRVRLAPASPGVPPPRAGCRRGRAGW